MKILRWMRLLGFGLFLGLAMTAGAADEPMKECPQCHGAGVTPCRAGCDHGARLCPGKCLKPSVGKWEPMTVEGHPPTDRWQLVKGPRGSRAWNQTHYGDVIEIRDGVPVLAGKCPVCGGTTKVKCAVCEGAGQVKCLLCAGSGQVPESVQPAVPPGEFLLKDGRTLRGKITMQRGEMLQIRTEDGKTVTLKRDELADPKAARFR